MQNHRLFLITIFIFAMATLLAAQDTVADLYEESYALETKGDYAGSLNKVLQILRADTRDYTANLRAGWLSYLQLDYNTALAYYKRAAGQSPDAVEPLLGLTLPLMAAKQWGEAEKAANAVIQRDSNNYLANSRLAYILFCLGKYGEARTRYEEVLRLYPSDLDMKLGLAWTYVRLGNKKKASEYFHAVLRVQKTNVNALSGIDVVKKM
jgi:tetratricopeptide (TPR) repeat protein